MDSCFPSTSSNDATLDSSSVNLGVATPPTHGTTTTTSSSTTTTPANTTRESLQLDAMELDAYRRTAVLLQSPASFLAPFPSVVSLRDIRQDPLPELRDHTTTHHFVSSTSTAASSNNSTAAQEAAAALAAHGLAPSLLIPPVAAQQPQDPLFELSPTSLLSPNKGHHALFRSLEELEGLEKEEATLMEQHSPLTAPLTQIVTGRTDAPPLEQLRAFGTIPRRVCQHPFKRNDIVWVCRTCQADETCVLCHACFSQSHHAGHDVAFYHAQAGGCCDCGDPDAWDPRGFCPHHGPRSSSSTTTQDENSPLAPAQVQRVRGVVPSVVDWMVERIAKNAQAGYKRAMTVAVDGTANNQNDNLQSAALMDDDDDDDDPNNNSQMDESASDIFRQAPPGFAPHAAAAAQAQQIPLHLQANLQLGNPNAWTARTTPIQQLQQQQLLLQQQQQQHTSSNTIDNNNNNTLFAQQLGAIGRQGHGLYLVLYADDIHSPSQWIDVLRNFLGASSYYTDSLLAKFVRALRKYGQLVVWGTMELVAECGSTNTKLWLDGDMVASAQIASALLKRAQKLIQHGFFCSIFTRHELQLEQRAVAVLQWVSALARSCDPLCRTVAECILPNRHLVPLLRADFKLSARITKAWYSLLLTLLAVPTFKSHLAAAYCDTYRSVTAKYAAGMGLLERSAYTLSVQFLNRVTYVVDLVQGRDLLGKLGKSLFETLRVAKQQQQASLALTTQQKNARLNPNHFVLSHRRYSPCISDLKCVLNVKGMRRLFACEEGTFLSDWVAALCLAQFMDTQVWRHWTHGHVEDEVRGWVGAFNLSISLGSLFERLLSWEDEEASPIKDPASPLSRNLLSCMQLTYHILISGISKWQQVETSTFLPTRYTTAIDPHKRSPASLPFSTVAAKHGCALAMQQLSIAQVTPFSFHLPLHRFLAACLRELCLREKDGLEALFHLIATQLPLVEEQDTLFRGLMEFPVLVLTRASQVRAGLWRRNGPGLNDQVLNYAEPPFCRSMRDADLLLVQFAVLKKTWHQSPTPRPPSDVGIAFLVHLLLHRLGIFDVSGLTKAPNSDINRYLEEVSAKLYPRELRPDTAMDGSDIVLPWTYSPARDAATRLVLLEEFLHLMVVFVVELPPLPPKDKEDHTNQAKDRLRREVIHRLASGPKTHSELSEVHLVLSYWDNVFLSEEGKLVNPDDATGAALGAVLEEVADRKSSRGKLEPDKWELRRSAWEAYDPSFYHVSLRSHQTAAENRPQPPNAPNKRQLFGHAKPYGPLTLPAHPTFQRLRRDVSADATLLAIAYRILHLHCRENKKKDMADLRGGRFAYEDDERSETALARAVHILTLGAFAWENAEAGVSNWREHGGGSVGSVFFDRPDSHDAPTANNWVEAALLVDPGGLLDCEWYSGEENAIVLLKRLAVDGGMPGSFVAGDRSVRAGAAWLCEFALKCSPAAAHFLGANATASAENGNQEEEEKETELQRKKRVAKEKAMARMKEQAAKFASMMKVELDDGGEDEKDNSSQNSAGKDLSFSSAGSDATMHLADMAASTHHHPTRSSSLGSNRSLSSISVETNGAESEASLTQGYASSAADNNASGYDDAVIPDRLLKVRPRCIICNDEYNAESSGRPSYEEETHKRSRRRKMDGGNALCFVAYGQASTVMKGGGGPPSPSSHLMAPVRRYVGAHVALCGHAVHSECCEAYLAIVSHREERVIGKRDEFRCPLCQRLSNCLVPFIDVGEDWICQPTSSESVSNEQAISSAKSEADVDMLSDWAVISPNVSVPLQKFLSTTPWWVSRHNPHVVWDGQSAFISKSILPTSDVTGERGFETTTSLAKPRRRSVRSLRKKDLYAAWNAMMRTPRFVRRKFRHRSNDDSAAASSRGNEMGPIYVPDVPVETSGETAVWRRFMDQVCDVAYRADSKRLGEENLHNDFGEFRHYIVEKFSYNLAKRAAGIEPADWPSCVFSTTLSETQRQELSREKLLSKLLMTIQSFTYSCCCEAAEARREVRKHFLSSREVAGLSDSSSFDTICSKFGITGVLCDGKLVLMPHPSSKVDDGSQPFNGRLGRLRYLGLAAMAAAGAVAADLVQLALCFPHNRKEDNVDGHDIMDVEKPERAPIAYPILYGNVLTHVVAAITAACGRARARSDSLELAWPVPFSIRGSFAFADSSNDRKRSMDSTLEDCEGFLKLGLLARTLQVLLAVLEVKPGNVDSAVSTVVALRGIRNHRDDNMSNLERSWVLSCLSLLEGGLGDNLPEKLVSNTSAGNQNGLFNVFNEACVIAAGAACSFLVDISTVLQVLVPGVMSRYDCQSAQMASSEWDRDPSLRTFEKLRVLLEIEPIEEMLQSSSVLEIVSYWFNSAHEHARAAGLFPSPLPSNSIWDETRSIRHRLYRTQGFHAMDWPMQSSPDFLSHLGKASNSRSKVSFKVVSGEQEPQHGSMMQVEALMPTDEASTTTPEVLRQQSAPTLVTFSAKKTVPLIGGYCDEALAKQVINSRPRVAVIPTSYTDLYAELGALLPDCEQTAVCLICGEVLNAGGKGECTRHSYKCGAGTGLFFLLQECSGLIMHKGKAAYIHSPYVDSHGETPQYRGRPLNLDLARYDHLREIFLGHAVRQQVLAERGSSRQVIVPDFY
ncbi:protein ligase UBR2 [Seminavis robusta]|uniref:E3 ubiquitin-protein ligase n=1 Tax=Seminavis robusta TaxID=568900 RepID=A0A9N8HDJ7_9STRA|nr:protein ligase UBR2 [Seminavis robusta]|eukprot:Sro430_g141370.1 protein ligase UBR2 (2625) ;mRNA; r:50536-58505